MTKSIVKEVVERFEALGEQVYFYEARRRATLFCAINDAEAVLRAKAWVPNTYNGHLSCVVFRVHPDLKLGLLDGWTPCNQNESTGCGFNAKTGWFHDGQGYDYPVGSEFQRAWKGWLEWLKEEKILEKKEGLLGPSARLRTLR